MTRAVLVARRRSLLQRVDQRGAPAGVVVAQPGQLHVGPDPGQQLGGGERLDQVVVGAGLQALDGRLLPGPGRQQQHRHGGGARVGAQRGRPAAARPGRGIITSLMTRSGAAARTASSAACPSVTAVTW